MRDCDNVDVQDVLPDYASGALGAADRVRVERHLDGCEACRAELAAIRAVRGARPAPAVDVARIVAALPKPPAAAAPPADVVSLDAHRARREARGGAGWQWRRAAGIAAVLVAGAGTWAAWQRTAPQGPRRSPTVSVETLTVATQPPDTAPVRPTPLPPVRPPRVVADADLGSLGGVASDASDEELTALLAALGDISGVPEIEAEEAVQEGGA